MEPPICPDSRMAAPVTIIMPTHDHGELIHSSIRCALAQTFQDFELVIIGDGAPAITREIVMDYGSRDERIRYHEFEKGPRLGEAYRHGVLQEYRGRSVMYLADDDIWLPNHVAYMVELLEHADFAQAFRLTILQDGAVFIGNGHFSVPEHREELLNGRNFVGLSAAAHTRDIYDRLPFGWRTTPSGIATDLYMWQQFLSMPECRAITGLRPTVIGLAQALRGDCSFAQRRDELLRWERFAQSESAEQQAAMMALDFLLRRRAELESAYTEFTQHYAAHQKAINGFVQQVGYLEEEVQRLTQGPSVDTDTDKSQD